MNQTLLKQGVCKELEDFPYILEFAHKKNSTIQFNSFDMRVSSSLCIYFVLEGKFSWLIDKTEHTLYPGDLAIILPGQQCGNKESILNIGTIMWVTLDVGKAQLIGNWSHLCKKDRSSIEQILLTNKEQLVLKLKEAGALLQQLHIELMNEEVGFASRVVQMLDEIFITTARQLIRQNNSRRDFPQTFFKLEQALRQNLAHQWSVEEMAAFTGMGTTAFTEKVKSFSGFSPLNYLINLRITEAIKLLKRNEVNVTEIALKIGFYSSQHFSTTFKKLTGYTPSEFRKNNNATNQT